jgi:hypothetical protein
METNNQSLQTVVETFFIQETVNLVHDNDALQKWNEKVEELELKGQKQIVVEDKSPIPFLWMNTALIATFQTLCPTKTPIEKYSKTPIPVELLEIVSLCKKEGYFYRVDVWYNEKQKDPVIIGYKFIQGTSDWEKEYYSEKYLIGRWADVKASLDQLIKRAKELFIAQGKTMLQLDIKKRQRELEDIEQLAEQQFGGAIPPTDLPF